MINVEDALWPKLKPIIQDISNSLTLNPTYKVECCNRSSNKVADRIANESLTFMSCFSKLYSIQPVWLRSVLEADMPL